MPQQEVELDIKQGSNPEYKNLYLNDLSNDGDYVIVTKREFPDAYDTGRKTQYGSPMYSCKAYYKDTPVSFMLFKDKEVEAFNNAGGVDDKVKVTRKKELGTNSKGQDFVRKELLFEKVQ